MSAVVNNNSEQFVPVSADPDPDNSQGGVNNEVNNDPGQFTPTSPDDNQGGEGEGEGEESGGQGEGEGEGEDNTTPQTNLDDLLFGEEEEEEEGEEVDLDDLMMP